MTEELRVPVSDADWVAYHAIRRHVLFELRGQGFAYDANHPDEHQPAHHPMLLWIGNVPVGAIRIDVHGAEAIFRRVAIRADLQRRGYGRRLLELAEGFARGQGCVRVESHVDPGAIGFYYRCGYVLIDPKDRASSPRMAKKLT